MQRVLGLALAAAVVTAGSAVSQNYTVFPSDHTGVGPNLTLPGASYVASNPYWYGVARQMMFYDHWDLHIPNGRSISRIGFPRDPGLSSTGYGILLKVQMGQSTLSLANVSTTFATNFTTTPTNVFANATGAAKIFTLPNLGTPGVDTVWLPLDAPFTFNASQSLVVDFQVSANQNGNNAFNYYLDSAGVLSADTSIGQACMTSGGATPRLTSSSTYVGGNWALAISSAPSTTPMILFVGVAPQNPGIALDIIGMTGCLLSVDPQWTGGYVSNSGGYYNWNFPVPNNRALFGGRLYSQVAMLDVFANSFGWITSNGDDLQLGIQPQATLIYGGQGNAQATTGNLATNFGLITIFDHN